jgi:F-type H+-transporting ATPase subunit alpha
VSRVGGNAQIKAMKQVAGRLRLDLAQYRELEAFAEFGSDLDRASRAQLNRGARLVELLKQPQFQPMTAEKQVISIWAITSGQADGVPVEDIRRFESELHDHLDASRPDLGKEIAEAGTLPEETEGKLREAVEEFRKGFRPSGEAPPPREAEAEALEEEQQEALKKRVRRPRREG